MDDVFSRYLSRHGSGKFSSKLEEICNKYKLIYEKLDDSIIETVSGRNVFTGKAHDFETEHNPSYSILGSPAASSDANSSLNRSLNNDNTKHWDNMSILSYSHFSGIAKVSKELERQRKLNSYPKSPFASSSESSCEEINQSSEEDDDEDFWKIPQNDCSLPQQINSIVASTGQPVTDDVLGNSFDASSVESAKSSQVEIIPQTMLVPKLSQTDISVSDGETDFESNEENSISLRSHMYSCRTAAQDHILFSPPCLLNSPFRKISLKESTNKPSWHQENVLECLGQTTVAKSTFRSKKPLKTCSVVENHAKKTTFDAFASEDSDFEHHNSIDAIQAKVLPLSSFSDSSSEKGYFSLPQNSNSCSDDDICTIKPKTKHANHKTKSSSFLRPIVTNEKKMSAASHCDVIATKPTKKTSAKKHIRKINQSCTTSIPGTNTKLSPQRPIQQNIRCDVLCSSDEENDLFVTPKQNRTQKLFSSTMKLRSGKAKTSLFYC